MEEQKVYLSIEEVLYWLKDATTAERLDIDVSWRDRGVTPVVKPEVVQAAFDLLEQKEGWSRQQTGNAICALLMKVPIIGCPSNAARFGCVIYSYVEGWNWASCAVASCLSIDGSITQDDVAEYADLFQTIEEYKACYPVVAQNYGFKC